MIDRVLFLMEEFCDANPACGSSGAEHQVVGAVESTGLVGETKHFYFDMTSQRFGREMMEEHLLQDCLAYRPSLIIYTPLGGEIGQRLNPSHRCMQAIMNNLHIPVYLNLWDAPERGLREQWLPSATLLGVDSLIQNYHSQKHPQVIFVHSTVDPRIHFNRNIVRDIDVSFVGSMDTEGRRWPHRYEYISYLKKNGINVVVAGGQRGSGRIPIEECANILNRSKISLDFCMSTDGKPTMHLRSFEITACGAMLMLDQHNLLSELFEGHFLDMVVFDSKVALLEWVQYFLNHESKRKEIARNGWLKGSGFYNARNMWGYIFERLGFELPKALTENPAYKMHKSVIESI